jgi:hypothetical protein
MNVVCIVEGHGEVEALPVVVRRVAQELGVFVRVPQAIRQPKSKLLRDDDLRRAVQLAAKRAGPSDAILVLLDADDDCPAALAPRMLATVRAERPDRRIAIVLATREFEAWFLAAADSLVGANGLLPGTKPPAEPERVRDAKGWMSQAMGSRYSEVLDQPRFAARFDMAAARSACPSFDKLWRELASLLQGRGGGT